MLKRFYVVLKEEDIVILEHLIKKELVEFPEKYAMKSNLISEYRKMLLSAKLKLNQRRG